MALNGRGNGNPIVLTSASSVGCDVGRYVDGQRIRLSAESDEGWPVEHWQRTDSDKCESGDNTLTMPVGDHVISVTYSKDAPEVGIALEGR